MSNSKLISGTCLNTACSNPRGGTPIRKITIHHMAGVATAMNCAQYHKNVGGVSANYYIGNGGEIVLGVDESRRAWTSSSRENDYQAVTLEVSNSRAADPWPVSDAAYKSMIALCVDVCQRNGIKSLKWTGDETGTLTCHYMFAATGCPGQYLTERMPKICAEINDKLAGGDKPHLTDEEQIYTVKNGDTWESVGSAYGMGLTGGVRLLEYNNYKTANAALAGLDIKQKTIKIPAAFVTGDTDGDGKITAKDARLALRASAKLATLTPAQRMRADYDGDGTVSAKDARTILRLSAGLK